MELISCRQQTRALPALFSKREHLLFLATYALRIPETTNSSFVTCCITVSILLIVKRSFSLRICSASCLRPSLRQ